MVAKTDAVPDAAEDIIDLTDIIAQGTPPSAPGEPAVSADDPLRDLKNSDAGTGAGEGGEDDLDALLAEIGASPPAAGNAPGRENLRPVNPDETLDMPDMREVENLLDGLNLPAQPPPASADAAAAKPAPPAPADDLDALLDSVAPAPAAPAPPAPTAAGKPDALPGSTAPAAPATSPAPTAAPPMPAAKPAPEAAPAPVAPATRPAPTAVPAPPPPAASATPAETGDPDALPDSAALPAAAEKTPSPASDAAAAPPQRAAARATASDMETPPLPRQWENLLGSVPERDPAAPPGSAPGVAPVAPAFLERMERLEKRLAQLETRLNGMERGAREDLDRAAASAAARILREELAAIFAEGTQ
ncbi:MAG: hypothetical protein LBC79_02200 [Deltaproteobacteria bacterium]|jgi:hypothetical protein|nr:hypothetical protein [Deltaproteobacteria bacterium]